MFIVAMSCALLLPWFPWLQVREVLAKKQTEMENKEKIRNFRLQKKFSKKVQAEVRVNKAAQKKAMLDEVKKFRKGQRKDLDFLDDDGTTKKPLKKKTRLDPSTILQHSKGKGTGKGPATGKGTIKR
jgi:hypothetical protein